MGLTHGYQKKLILISHNYSLLLSIFPHSYKMSVAGSCHSMLVMTLNNGADRLVP